MVNSRITSFLTLLIISAGVIGCGGNNTPSYVESPGNKKTAKDKLLNTGADLLQDKSPITYFNAYLNGFHFYNGNLDAQMEAHHYVQQVNEDLYQAIILDGNKKDAKLMGVEYIVTERLFKTLAAEERRLWHSHDYEVKSGLLIAPGIPQLAEHELMEKLVKTYGKTIHTWHTDQERDLPVGAPMVMMGFTEDGQVNTKLVKARDERFNVQTEHIGASRNDIKSSPLIEGANAWEKGDLRQFIITDKPDSALHKHQVSPER